MALQYILDGYNIIKCDDVMADCSLEQGRNMLLKILAQDRPQGSLRNDVLVVFDGKDDVWGQQSSSVVKVVFSSGETADDLIKHVIDGSVNLKNTIVVTNDGELACYVRKSGAKVSSVQKFMPLRSSPSRTLSKKKKQSSESVSHKNITRVTAGKINKEMEDVWINKKNQVIHE